MPRSEVIRILGESKYHKSAETKYGIEFQEKDFYYDNSFQILYNKNSIVEFVEAGKNEEIVYEIFGKNIFELSWKDLIRLLEEKSEETIKKYEEITNPVFLKLDIGLYREDNSSRYADSIGIGIKGYFK
ncbi:MAG: hypothetical protein NT148_01080 [Candidatus Nealsonbacteria bacterium]|nr:hypothetical protein [Candidatus Nealsonbacteria bacterium]